ncbi:MAG: hypothetical protein Q4G28_09815 [Neisseria sp.]|nr:hypothetical protein [Neisseria sp.]
MTPLFLGQSLWSHLLATCAFLVLLMSCAWLLTFIMRNHREKKDDD